jgi:hypothetical protein
MTAILRSLKGAPLSCLIALSTVDHPVEAQWLCEMTGYSHGTITAGLRALAAHGFVTHNPSRSGWRLTPRGKIVHIRDTSELKAPQEKESQVEKPDIDPQLPNPFEPTPKSGAGRNFCDSGSQAKLRESDYKDIHTESDSNLSLSLAAEENNDSEKGQLEKILESCELILGEPVIWPKGVNLKVETTLACIAQAYVEREKFSKPARVVYANLRHSARPAEKYLRDPYHYLPERYLEAVGLDRSYSRYRYLEWEKH